MLIPLGFLAASGAAAGSFDLLETTVLTGSQASVEFTNLTSKYSALYQHLQIRYVARSTRSATDDDLRITYNGSTTGYYRHQLYGGELSTAQSFATADRVLGFLTGANSASNNFAAGVIDLLDPFETKNKTARALTGATDLNRIFLRSNAWFTTDSVTTINLAANSGNLVQYSRFSLYGLKAA
jgi:hypothetical protein